MPRKGWSSVVPLGGCKSFEDRNLQWRSGFAPRLNPHPQTPSLTVTHRQSQKLQMQGPRRSPAEVRAASTKILRIQAAIASLAADDMEERSSLEAAMSLPSSRQAHRRYVSFHCTGEETHCSRVCKDRVSREAEAGLRGRVGTGGEGSGMFLTRRPRRHKQDACRSCRDPVAALEAELSRVRTELAQLKWCGSRCTVWAGAIPTMRDSGSSRVNLWLEERHADLHEVRWRR